MPKNKANAISLLPNGSELLGVMLPRYDRDHCLAGVLKARIITLVTDELIASEDVSIEFFSWLLDDMGLSGGGVSAAGRKPAWESDQTELRKSR